MAGIAGVILHKMNRAGIAAAVRGKLNIAYSRHIRIGVSGFGPLLKRRGLLHRIYGYVVYAKSVSRISPKRNIQPQRTGVFRYTGNNKLSARLPVRFRLCVVSIHCYAALGAVCHGTETAYFVFRRIA